MAKQIINNGESGLVVRTKINENFTEVYNGDGSPVQSVNAKTGDVVLTKADVNLGNVNNTSDLDKPVSNDTQTALDLKVDENVAITGATKTKITYDAKGLVTTGEDLIEADIPNLNASKTNAGQFANARISESSITQHEGAINHDNLFNYDINEHRIINDVGNTTTELFSANKINTELDLKLAIADVQDINTGYATKTGNDLTGQVGNINRPFGTIQGALDATNALGLSAVNRGIVHIGPGIWAEDLTLYNYLYAIGTSNTTILVGAGGTGEVVNSLFANGGGIDSGISNVIFSCTPASDGTIFVKGDTGRLNLGGCTMSINDANNFSFTGIQQNGGLLISPQFSKELNLTGTGTPTGDIVLVEILGTAVYIPAIAFTQWTSAQAGGDIIGLRDNSTGKSALATLDITYQTTNPAYSGNIKHIENISNATFNKVVSAISVIAVGAGSGNFYAVYSDNASPSIIEIQNIFCRSLGFANSYFAWANQSNNIINFVFASVGDNMMAGGTGIINKILEQGGKLRLNTGIIDETLAPNSPTIETLQQILSSFFNAGWTGGNDITDNGDGTVNIDVGNGAIRISNSETALLQYVDIPLINNLALTDASWNYIYVDYNGGSPIIANTITSNLVRDNNNDKYELYAVYRDGNILKINDTKQRALNTQGQAQKKDFAIGDLDYLSGLKAGETGTRNITITAGLANIKYNPLEQIAFDTSLTDTIDFYYNGGLSVVPAQTQYNNTQYDLAGVLTAFGGGTRFNFMDVYLLGNGDYIGTIGDQNAGTVTVAKDAPQVALPMFAQNLAIRIARFVIEKGVDTANEIIDFTGATATAGSGTSDHSLLSNLASDDHIQYILGIGRAGGQTISGGTGVGENLTLQSTSNATKGEIPLTDGELAVINTADNTKKIKFSGANITTATTRTLTAQDKDYVIADNADLTNHTSDATIHFADATILHNNRSDLQGGTANEYNHLTNAQHTIATQPATPSVAGYVNTTIQTFAGVKTFNDEIVEEKHFEIKNQASSPANTVNYTKIYSKKVDIGGNDANTELLIHSDTTNGSTTFTDSSSNGFTITNIGSTKHMLGVGKFGKTGIYFLNAKSQALSIPSHANLTFGTGDFTVDFIIDCAVVNVGNPMDLGAGSGVRLVMFSQGGGYRLLNGAGTICEIGDLTGKKHVAIVRSSGTLNTFLNGVLVDSKADTTNYPANVYYFGKNNPTDGDGGNSYFLGSIDEIRISIGVARWTANFDPPKQAYDTPTTDIYAKDDDDVEYIVLKE